MPHGCCGGSLCHALRVVLPFLAAAMFAFLWDPTCVCLYFRTWILPCQKHGFFLTCGWRLDCVLLCVLRSWKALL